MTPNNINPNSANSDTKQEEHITFSVHDLIQTVIANWYWFVIPVFVCVGCGYIYILRTPKIYSRTANILVKDSRKGGDTDLATLSDLAGLSQRRNVDNEIYILQSRRLMTEVVKQLGLTVQYETKDGLRPQDLYGQSPIAVEFINDNDRQGFRFEVSLRPDSIVKLNYFEIFGPDKQKFKQEISAVFGDTISTPVGQMIIRPTLYMSPDYYEKAPIRVTKGNLGVVTQFYQHEVKSFVANKQASIITISMRSSVPKKAEDVINTLIAVYEKDAIDDKRGIAESTGQFIDNRLAIISGELSEVDRNIEKFKKDNKIYDIVSEAEQTITESAQYKVDGLSLENQIRMTEFLKEYLLDPAKANELIPGTLSINSPAINTQIDAYNTELQRYMKLNSDNSGNNPIVQDLGNGLASTRRVDHRDARLLYLHPADSTGGFTEGRGADQSTNILGTDAGKTDSGHRPTAENQGRAIPLSAQQARGKRHHDGHHGKQLAHDRQCIRLPAPRVAQYRADCGNRLPVRAGYSFPGYLSDSDTRHHDPGPKGHRRQPLDSVPGGYSAIFG